MRQWPWITIILAIAVALNPVGLSFLNSAFFSNEQLSRSIAQPFVLMAIAILAALAMLEFWIKRRRRIAAGK
jgi:hypothetical protein